MVVPQIIYTEDIRSAVTGQKGLIFKLFPDRRVPTLTIPYQGIHGVVHPTFPPRNLGGWFLPGHQLVCLSVVGKGDPRSQPLRTVLSDIWYMNLTPSRARQTKPSDSHSLAFVFLLPAGPASSEVDGSRGTL